MNDKEKIQLFVNEINDIEDENLKKFVIKLLLGAPEYFYTMPASSTKKYHPLFTRSEGGLIKHTRLTVFFALIQAEALNFSKRECDLLIISAIAHDILKQGDGKTKRTVFEHPKLASEYVMDMQSLYPTLISKEDAKLIADAVICHMGKYTHDKEYIKNNDPLPLPSSSFQHALQIGDLLASRTQLLDFEFRPTEGVELNFQCDDLKDMIIENCGNTVLEFGKHKGKTIKEMVNIDKNYAKWFAENIENKKEIKEKVKLYLESV